ncbi:MAG: hypothetical protein ACRDT0_15015 [Pseudonocardiaceae bacterium]
MTTTTTTPTSVDVRAALLELLTTGQHHRAATPATLAAVGDTRATLATEHGDHDPTGTWAPHPDRLAALATALGELGAALAGCRGRNRRPDPARLHPALTALAAVALGWLDALAYQTDDDESPF